MHKKPVEMSKYEDAHKQYVKYKKEFEEWVVKRDKATGDEKKRIDEQERIDEPEKPKYPKPGDAHGLYKFEYLYYTHAKTIWLIRKEEANCEKEKTWLDNNRPQRPLPPQPSDSEINEFVFNYLKVCTCAHSSVLLPGSENRWANCSL